jgi:hypothetical protein
VGEDVVVPVEDKAGVGTAADLPVHEQHLRAAVTRVGSSIFAGLLCTPQNPTRNALRRLRPLPRAGPPASE